MVEGEPAPGEHGAIVGPDDVAERVFRSSLRGYEQAEVREFLAEAAGALRAAEARAAALERRVQELSARPAPAAPAPGAAPASQQPSHQEALSATDLATTAGREVARIIAAAKESAADVARRADAQAAAILAAAEREASRIRVAAEDEASRLLADAESVLSIRTEEAERIAADIRSRAEAVLTVRTQEADAVVARVKSEAEKAAEEERSKARLEGRRMVQEAQAVRERVLRDMARRRRQAHVQLEQLRVGRERLLAAYRIVRATMDEATRELTVAEVEARAAAEAAGRRVPTEPEPTLAELEAELAAARDVEPPVADQATAERETDQRAARTPAPTLQAPTGAEASAPPSWLAPPAAPIGSSDAATSSGPTASGPTASGPTASGPPRSGAAGSSGAGGSSASSPFASAAPAGAQPASLPTTSFPRPRSAESDKPSPSPALPWSSKAVRPPSSPRRTTSVGASGRTASAPAPEPTPDAAEPPAGNDSAGTRPGTVRVLRPAGDEPPALEPPLALVETTGPEASLAMPTASPVMPVFRPGAPADAAAGVALEPSGDAQPEPQADSASEHAAVAAALGAHEPDAEPAAVDVPAPDAAGAADPGAHGRAPVEDLFARLRAERAAAVAHAQEVLAKPAGAVSAVAAAATSAARQVGASASPLAGSTDQDERELQRRDDAIEAVDRAVSRALKRALADEQNDVLDRLRRHGGSATLEALLPGPDEHARRFADAVVEAVTAAAEAGMAFAGSGTGEPPDTADVGDEVAAEIANGVRIRLRAIVADARVGDDAALSESISACYREWKTQRLDSLARHASACAFARGAFCATPAGTPVRWLVDDDDGGCPDCDDNALAGFTPAGEPFPTGHLQPPAHVGCRCLLVARNQ